MRSLSDPQRLPSSPEARFGLYFAPAPDDPLWHFGSQWLGRDAVTGNPLPTPVVPAVEATVVHTLTAAPRRYGFHATLKAPFRLAAGRTPDELIRACKSFASTHAPVSIGALHVRLLGGFAALTPEVTSTELRALAFSCVRAFDTFRAPMSAAERSRRRPEHLLPRERELLDQWGYPYVDDAYRFHLTLTDPLDPAMQAVLMPWLTERYRALAMQTVTVDAISLFLEARPGADFICVERFHLGG